jgi:hypothetical protein
VNVHPMVAMAPVQDVLSYFPRNSSVKRSVWPCDDDGNDCCTDNTGTTIIDPGNAGDTLPPSADSIPCSRLYLERIARIGDATIVALKHGGVR